jgi:hypothetical protein
MRCDECPVRPGLACWGETHPPACGYVAAGRREWIAHLVAMAEGKPGNQGTIATSPRPAVREEVRLSLLRNACPHAKAASCGCSDLRQCSLGKGKDGIADRATCYACLRERETT